jgi:hypothetical protein
MARNVDHAQARAASFQLREPRRAGDQKISRANGLTGGDYRISADDIATGPAHALPR